MKKITPKKRGPKPFPKSVRRVKRRTVLLNPKEDRAFAAASKADGFDDVPKWLRHLGHSRIADQSS